MVAKLVESLEIPLLDRNGEPTNETLRATPALADLLVLAWRVNVRVKDEVDVSFTSTLIALLVAADPVARWFQRYVTAYGVDTDAVLSNRDLDEATLKTIAREPISDADRLRGWYRSGSLTALLGTAIDYANHAPSTPDAPVDARHLLAAYIYRPAGHDRQLEEWGFDRIDWSNDFLTSLADEDEQERDYWRREHEAVFGVAAGRSVTRPQISGYAADRADGEDLLGIKNEVAALATLIASSDVAPPLSIGLFGEWGSGKTFFMRHLKRRVARIAAEARASPTPQKDLKFYKRIAQVDFNAWHYDDGDLWASLVEHLFSHLSLGDEETPEMTQERQRHWVRQIVGAEQALAIAQGDLRVAEAQLEEAQNDLTRIRQEQNDKQQEIERLTTADALQAIAVDSALRQTIEGFLTPLGLTPVGEQARELQTALHAAKEVVGRGYGILAPMQDASDPAARRRRWIELAVALGSGPVVSLTLGGIVYLLGPETLAATTAFFGGIASMLGTGTRWIQKQTAWTGRQIMQIETFDAQIQRQVAERVAEHQTAITAAEVELRNLRASYDAASQREVDAAARVAAIQEEAPPRVLARFIHDRAASEDYRKLLGTLALVRRDFEKLEDLLADEDAWLKTIDDVAREETEKPYLINRIVLYIDDLDRCRPKTVVNVLQAAHLLLAFPYFVVVIGVDARWVTRALQEHYATLLRAGADEGADNQMGLGHEATPLDYLEKIFQIPIWLEPMDDRDTRTMLGALLDASLIDPAMSDAGATGGRGSISALSTGRGGGAGPGAAGRESNAADDGISLDPTALGIQLDEFAFMESLAPLLGRSPRSLKRFVNVYRLIKASLTPRQRKTFLADGESHPPYQVALLLLAVESGCPSVARSLFGEILSQPSPMEPGTISTFATVAMRVLSANVEPSDRARFARWFANADGQSWAEVDIERLRDGVNLVARYSFRIEHVPFASNRAELAATSDDDRVDSIELDPTGPKIAAVRPVSASTPHPIDLPGRMPGAPKPPS